MSDQGTSRPNGAAEPATLPKPKSLREVAEDAYDEVIEAAGPEDGDDGETAQEAPAGQDGQPRDRLGRFAAKPAEAQPGEAEAATQPPPSPETEQPQQPPAHPAPTGSSSEAPANWSAEDRKTFSELPQPAQQFLLRRHSEMEGDYQRRVKANAAATEFTNSLAPIFTDPVISGSLEQSNLSAYDAIREWATMHKRAMSPDMRDRAQLWHEIGTRLGLDPAAVYGQSPSSPQGLTEKDLQDPAIKFFADHVSRTTSEVQALRGTIAAMQQADAQRQSVEAAKVTRWGIDSFADEKDAQGNLKHPHFDAVLPELIQLFKVDPNRDMNAAYEQALWMNPQTRSTLITAERTSAQKQISNERAKAAVRVNARGLTSPVAKPPREPGAKAPSLRETLEQSADEVGFG